MERPEFWLRPWDRKRPFREAPLADAVLAHDGKTYLLRVENGLLFLRDAARNDEEFTWTITTPLDARLESEGADLRAFFAAQMNAGNVARYVLHSSGVFQEREFPLFLRGDGTGFCRESWNRDDLPFSHAVTRHEWLETPASQLAKSYGGDIYEKFLHDQLEKLDFAEAHHRPLAFLCGSANDLREVTRWICAFEPSIAALRPPKQVEVSFQGETEFTRAGLLYLSLGDAHFSFEYNEKDGHCLLESYTAPSDWSQRFMTLLDLALDFNTPTGITWEYHDWGAGRASHSPSPELVEFNFTPADLPSPAEAREKLEEWLVGKLPDDEIEALLDDATPAHLPIEEN